MLSSSVRCFIYFSYLSERGDVLGYFQYNLGTNEEILKKMHDLGGPLVSIKNGVSGDCVVVVFSCEVVPRMDYVFSCFPDDVIRHPGKYVVLPPSIRFVSNYIGFLAFFKEVREMILYK